MQNNPDLLFQKLLSSNDRQREKFLAKVPKEDRQKIEERLSADSSIKADISKRIWSKNFLRTSKTLTCSKCF